MVLFNVKSRLVPPARTLLAFMVTGIVAGSLSFAVHGQEQRFYRFTNKDGVVVMKSSITAEEAELGYSIVSVSGRVIETVAPMLSDEEYEKLSEERKQELEKERRADEEKAYNESLMLRYSTLEDLEAEKARKLAEFDVRISILRGNMASLKSQVERQQEVAANIERRGSEVPAVIQNNILDLQQKVRDAERSLISRQQEKVAVDKRYAEDAKKFEMLIKGLEELDGNGSGGAS